MRSGSRHTPVLILVPTILFVWVSASPAGADGGYFTTSESVAVSADQRAIIIQNGREISITYSTGYTGQGDDFSWIIPVPVPPALEDVREAGEDGERAFELLDRHTAPVYTRRSGCFPAGTEVLTAEGPRPIETIGPGAEVHSFDPSLGRWVLKNVVRRHTHRYTGDIVTIRLGSAVIRATGNHPFFVERGDDLASRPLPRDVPEAEQGAAQRGRWVEARDLQEGDVLLDKGGRGPVVAAVSSRDEDVEVYNLQVEGLHNYAVHRQGILVHNKGGKEEPATPESLVTVYGQVTLEHYQVSILGAAAASPLLSWLARNGYAVDPVAERVLDAYIEEGWAFAAARLNPGERRRYENEFLPPLTIRYRDHRLVFPLRISSVSTVDTVRITLYVIAESTVSASNLPTTPLAFRESIPWNMDAEAYVEDCIRETAGSGAGGEPGLVVLLKGKHQAPQDLRMVENSSGLGGVGEWLQHQSPVDLRAALEGLMEEPFPPDTGTRLTRLEARLGPSEMTRDIRLAADPTPLAFRVEMATGQSEPGTQWKVPGLSGVTALAIGGRHTLALGEDGTVWSWGVNQYGELGDGTTTERLAPVQVRGLTDVVAVAAGNYHSVALRRDGTVWTWGGNWSGQLADGGTTDSCAPVQVPGLSGVIAVSKHMALDEDGSVWTWGYNYQGQLGDGTRTHSRSPIRVRGLPPATAVSAGFSHSVAVAEDGSVWAWGENLYGQLGDGTSTDHHKPIRVPGISGVVAVCAGFSHTAAVKADGTVWTWGNTYEDESGYPPKNPRPVQLKGLPRIVALSAASAQGKHTVALAEDATVWGWGQSGSGQLGDRGSIPPTTPAQITGLSGVVALAAGEWQTAVVARDGTVWIVGGYR